jgi:hypothetical protein
MTKLMRKLPTYLAATFLLVQINGLAAYAAALLKSDIGGLLFSLALEAAVFGSAYWTRDSITRKDGVKVTRDAGVKRSAWVVLIAGLIVSALLNTAKTMAGLSANASDLDRIAAAFFGMCPTLFAAGLGVLQGFVDRLPHVQGKQAQNAYVMRVYAILENVFTLVERATAPKDAADVPAVPLHECQHCGDKVENLGSHVRWTHPKVKK